MTRTLLVLFFLPSLVCGQQLSNDQFHITYTAAGLTTLKHVHDAYDTDYLLPGRPLGDVLIRYRVAGETAWQRALSATPSPVPPSLNAKTSQNASYTIGRPVPTIATSSRLSSSAGSWGLGALNDQVEPTTSADSNIPFFFWGDRHGTQEWVQYDFKEPQEVSFVEVFWAQGDAETKCSVPTSWSLQYRDGDQWKPVAASTPYTIELDHYNRVTFSPVTTQALRLVVQLPADATSGIFEWRVNTSEGKKVEPVHEIDPTETFRLEDDALRWTITIRNQTTSPVEIGDLGIPLPFNTQYVWDKTETYTKRLIRHSFIGGGGSYVFWMRTNAEGPYLVMTPQSNSGFEYFDQGLDRNFTAYIHSSASREELAAKGGKWRLPETKRTLSPRGRSGDSATYSFTFRWAKDYDAVHDVLYQEGGFDVNIVPGMTVPTDLNVLFSLHTHNRIREIAAEFPDKTVVRGLGEKGRDTHVYQVRFSRLGENMLKVRYGDGQYLALDFFVTEPLETLIKKRAHFLVTQDQWRDPKRWYNGLYSQWDMKNKILRSPDNLDGLQSYAVACDDTALGKAPYIAAKNVLFPDEKEIASVENYIHDYVWGGLQQTEKEPYPYGIYGIPNWKVNRESPYDDQRGKKHIWRIYDYPHIVLLYYEMYLVAKDYPGMVHYLDKDGYLERAYRTAMAFFTIPLEILKWSAYDTGTYNELVIPDLIRALEESGRNDEASQLRAHWETKAEHFINKHPDLYASEYPFDSTGFESTHALAKYAEERLRDPQATAFRQAVQQKDADDFLEEQMKLNIACRGTEPAYYWMGSDYRGSGNASYTLSYMAQMGGWAVEDYAMNFAKDPTPYLRLGYASYLSSWALLNSGTAESNYGYWYPGKENDGGAGGGFEPRPWGHAWLGNKEMGRGSWWYDGEIDLGFSAGLRMAATVVNDDPVFGVFAFGGDLRRTGHLIEVVPKDGLRSRFYIVLGSARVQKELDRDGFAENQPVTFDDSISEVKFIVENRASNRHETVLHLRGMPGGSYQVSSDGSSISAFSIHNGEAQDVKIPVGAGNATHVSLVRK